MSGPSLVIRPATEADAHRIAEIYVSSWQKAYRGIVPDTYLDALTVERRLPFWSEFTAADATPGLLVAELGGAIIGWITFGPSGDADAPDAAEVSGLYLDPDHYRSGVGTQLWTTVTEGFRTAGSTRVGVWVLEANIAARRFYEAMGCQLDPEASQTIERDGAILGEVRYWLEWMSPLKGR